MFRALVQGQSTLRSNFESIMMAKLPCQLNIHFYFYSFLLSYRCSTTASFRSLPLYKLSLVKLFYNIVNNNMPSTISDLAVWRNSPYDLRGYKKAVVPRFSTYFMKNSIRYRGAVLWNLVSDYFKDSCTFNQFYRNVQSDAKFREFRFTSSWKSRFLFKSYYPFAVLVIHFFSQVN